MRNHAETNISAEKKKAGSGSRIFTANTDRERPCDDHAEAAQRTEAPYGVKPAVALPRFLRLTDKNRLSEVVRFGKRIMLPGIRISALRAARSPHLAVVVPKAVDK